MSKVEGIEIRIARQAILASFGEQEAVEPVSVISVDEVIPTNDEVESTRGRDRFVNWRNKFMRIEKPGEQPSTPKVPY